jgi:hypothetical protein
MTLKKLDEAPLNPMKMNMKSPWKSYEIPRKKKQEMAPNGTKNRHLPRLQRHKGRRPPKVWTSNDPEQRLLAKIHVFFMWKTWENLGKEQEIVGKSYEELNPGNRWK